MSNRFHSHLILSGVALLAIFPLGILGLLNPIYIWPVFAVHLAFLFSANYYALVNFACDLPARYRAPALVLVFAVVITCLAMSLVPVTARDALIHHLTLPKWWLEQGRVSTFSWLDISFYPQLIQLAFIPILQFFPAQTCALYHLLYLLPVAGSAQSLARVILPRTSTAGFTCSAWAFVISITIPIYLRLSSEPLVDLPLAAFCGVATALLIERKLLGGVALGLALSIKYNALPYALFLFLVAPLLRVPLRFIIKFGLIALVIAAPWFARNFIETGNPFFPLGAGQGGVSSLQSRTLLYGESLLSLLFTPFSMLVDGKDDSPQHFDGVLSPLLLLGLLGAWNHRKNRAVVALSLMVIAYFLVAQFSSGARIRYLLPILPAVLAFTALGITAIPRKVAVVVFSAHLIWSSHYISERIERSGVVRYLTTNQTTSEYLERRIPEYRLTQSVSRQIAPSNQVYLVLTGNRFFYLPFRAQSAGYLSGPELLDWIERDTVDSELKQRNSRFLLVNIRLFESLRDPNAPFSHEELLTERLTRIASDGDLVLFKTK